jgi:hypothetical protein
MFSTACRPFFLRLLFSQPENIFLAYVSTVGGEKVCILKIYGAELQFSLSCYYARL